MQTLVGLLKENYEKIIEYFFFFFFLKYNFFASRFNYIIKFLLQIWKYVDSLLFHFCGFSLEYTAEISMKFTAPRVFPLFYYIRIYERGARDTFLKNICSFAKTLSTL